VEARKFYLDTQRRAFVSSPGSTLDASTPLFFDDDVEAVELFFLRPTGDINTPYEFLDYSANSVKFVVGTTTPAALQASWTALPTTLTVAVTSLVTGGSGTNEQQRVTFSQNPAAGGFAVQLPSRNVTVSSVSANVFTAADHGLYSGQSVSITAFSLTASAVANGSSYFVIRRSKDAFSLASTASSTTALTASVTSGGGTVSLSAVTTGQLRHNATPLDVQAALVAAGLSIGGAPQILVTGTAGREYVLTYANGSSNREYANVSIVGSTLLAAAGLEANVNFATNEIAALVAAGSTTAKLEIEVSGGGKRQTYQTSCALSSDIVSSTTPVPVPVGGTTATLNFTDGSGGTWALTVDANGVVTTSKL
jgi:hypothetical protein